MEIIPPNPPPTDAGTELAPGVRALYSALRFQFSRSSGPGGQNVNKVNTRAELWVPIGQLAGLTERAASRLRSLAGRSLTQNDEIHLVGQSARTQEGNRAQVLQRLRELLVAAMHEPKRRRKTKPSAGAKRRRIETKKRRGEIKSTRRYRAE